MNKRNYVNTEEKKSFISFLLGKKIPNKKVRIKNERLVMDEYGTISMNYSNPEVLKGIEERINEFQDMRLSRDIKLMNEDIYG